MGILLPFLLIGKSYKNIIELFNKINAKILELENKNKNQKEKYENDIIRLNEKLKKLEETFRNEKNLSQKLLKIKEKLENSNKYFEEQIKTLKESIIQKEKQIIDLENNISENNKKIKKEKEKIIEKCKQKLDEKENNIKTLSQKISIYQNNENDNLFKIKQLSQLVETYKKQFKENDVKYKLYEEKLKNYSNLEKQYTNLKDILDECNVKIENKDKLIKSLEFQISQLKQINNNTNENNDTNKKEEEFNQKLEIMKEKYESLMKENMNKTSKKLFKFIGDNLSKTKKKYEDIYKKREITMNSKFDEIIKLINTSNITIKNLINLQDNKKIEIKNSTFNFNLDDEVNNLSKTQVFSKKNLFNADNNIDIINNNNTEKKELNNGINTMNNIYQTPNGPNNINKTKEKNKINDEMDTPCGNENIINDNHQHNNEYSFDCTNAMYLTSYIYHGTDEAKFELMIKNNGDKIWPEKTKFKFLDSSEFTAEDITLNNQKPNEIKNYFVIIKNLKNYSVGEYKASLLFCVGEKIYGEKLILRIKIKEKDETNKKIKENIDKINEFRETFSLNENDYSNEKIYDILQENDFNYEQAFSSLFD